MAYPFWQYFKANLSLHCVHADRKLVRETNKRLVGQHGMHCCFGPLNIYGSSLLWPNILLLSAVAFHIFLFAPHVHAFGFCFKAFGGDCCFNMIQGLKQ